ncbi:MAG TPA: hypothetical protein DCM08_11335 [Microscillaceae bacterium]|nr:hypothetical protein [Microscillaceae bacterium]
MHIHEILIPITLFCSIAAVALMFIVGRHKERMYMIERGVSAQIFEQAAKRSVYNSLKYALLMIGFAIGLLLGELLRLKAQMEPPVAYFSMILLWGGLSLLLFYILQRYLMAQDAHKEAAFQEA